MCDNLRIKVSKAQLRFVLEFICKTMQFYYPRIDGLFELSYMLLKSSSSLRKCGGMFKHVQIEVTLMTTCSLVNLPCPLRKEKISSLLRVSLVGSPVDRPRLKLLYARHSCLELAENGNVELYFYLHLQPFPSFLKIDDMHACKSQYLQTNLGKEWELETNLILKITHVDRLLYSPARIEVFVLHQQELFLKRLKKEGKKRTSKYNNFR